MLLIHFKIFNTNNMVFFLQLFTMHLDSHLTLPEAAEIFTNCEFLFAGEKTEKPMLFRLKKA